MTVSREKMVPLPPLGVAGDDRPGRPAIFILTGPGDADARFVSGAITDYAVVVPQPEGICDWPRVSISEEALKASTSPLHVTGQRRGLPTPYKLSGASIIVPVGATTAMMPVMMMPVMIVRGLRSRTDGHGY